MPINTELIRIIETKGWLAVAEILGDNNTRVTINITDGAICINKAKNLLYLFDTSGLGSQYAYQYALNGGFIDGNYGPDINGSINLTPYQELRIIDLDIVQSFSLNTVIRQDLTEDILLKETIAIPPFTANLKTPTFVNDKMKYFATAPAFTSKNIKDKKDAFTRPFITKEAYDSFKSAQARFIAYVKAMTGDTGTDYI